MFVFHLGDNGLTLHNSWTGRTNHLLSFLSPFLHFYDSIRVQFMPVFCPKILIFISFYIFSQYYVWFGFHPLLYGWFVFILYFVFYLLLYGLYLHDFLIWFPFTTTFSSLYQETLVLHLTLLVIYISGIHCWREFEWQPLAYFQSPSSW